MREKESGGACRVELKSDVHHFHFDRIILVLSFLAVATFRDECVYTTKRERDQFEGDPCVGSSDI